MSVKSPSNVAASIRQRLLNRARSDHRPFNELLQYFAMERFLYRLSRSRHARRFVLKGALMLRAWNSPEFRATMDRRQIDCQKVEPLDFLFQCCHTVLQVGNIGFEFGCGFTDGGDGDFGFMAGDA